jgi:hypothetical protein
LLSRPAFGYGPYGTGHYSRWGGEIFAIQGRLDLVFTAAAAPRVTMQFAAASGITFDASALGVQRVISAEAIGGIVFEASGALAWTWDRLRPCATGAWTVTRVA